MDEVRLVVRGGLPNLLTLETVLVSYVGKDYGDQLKSFFSRILFNANNGHSVVFEIRNKNKSF